MTSEICLSCMIWYLEQNKIKIDVAEPEEVFEGIFEFAVQETSKDLGKFAKWETHHSKTGARSCHRVQSVDRMSLQYIYQIPIGNYMVTYIYMSFRILRLKDMFTFTVSEYTEYSLSREKVLIFQEHISCNPLCRWLVDSVELSSTGCSFLISWISHLCLSLLGFSS